MFIHTVNSDSVYVIFKRELQLYPGLQVDCIGVGLVTGQYRYYQQYRGQRVVKKSEYKRSGFFCTDSILIENDDIYFDAIECTW